MNCKHNGRALGSWFEKCLHCKRWRLIGSDRWWRKPMPSAPPDDDSGTQYEDFKGWLEDAA